MMIIRPCAARDLDALLALAESASVGLTTLPADRGLLEERVRASEHAFARKVLRPAGETYLFVMENLLTGKILGTCGILSRVGGFEPFYSYSLETAVHASPQLGVSREMSTLHVKADHKGPSEIGTLFVHPDGRGGGNGRLLSLSRFLFMAAFPERFAEFVLAEMRGVVDAVGHSPFWEAVGRHFFDIEFAEADMQSATDKQFIADLMPKHPIYIPMLPPEVQAVIGKVHPETVPAVRLLEQEGFAFANAVDIFDGGPMYRARVREVRTVRTSRVVTVARVVPQCATETPLLVSNERLDFRVCQGVLDVGEDGQAAMPRDVALALGVRLGDAVRFVEARPRAETGSTVQQDAAAARA